MSNDTGQRKVLLRRVLARLMDEAILLPAILVGGYAGGIGCPSQPDIVLLPPIATAVAGAMFCYVVASGIYYIPLHALSGQTIGKRVMRLRLMTQDQCQVSWEQSYQRWLGSWVSLLLLGYGYFLAAWEAHGRTLHDIRCRTQVVAVDAGAPAENKAETRRTEGGALQVRRRRLVCLVATAVVAAAVLTVQRRTPLLLYAVRHDNLVLASSVLAIKADPNRAGRLGMTPLVSAVERDDFRMVKLLVDNGARVNDRESYAGRTPLHASVDRPDIAAYLISRGADVNAIDRDGETPLHRAANYGDFALTKLLIENGARVSAMALRGWQGPAPVLPSIFSPDAVRPHIPLVRGQTPLSLAAHGGYVAIVKLLVSNGADVNARSLGGRTPMFGANLEVAKFLVSNGADVRLRDGDGRNALFDAAYSGEVRLVDFLIAQGADARVVDKDGTTPMHLAIDVGAPSIVASLLARGADPNVAEKRDKWTPLHVAAKGGSTGSDDLKYVRIAEMLVRHGANFNAKSADGSRPLDVAENEKHTAMATFLRQHMGNK